MKASRCPHCGSTDVAELVRPTAAGHDCTCLDCDGTWRNGGRR